MSSQHGRRDPPTCRQDLVQKAAEIGEDFVPAFDWIDDKVAIRVTEDPSNKGLTATEIRDQAREWILAGNRIRCAPEKREDYRERRHFFYDIVIISKNLPEFPRGLYVEMELGNSDEDDPTVNLLNAHPQRP